jgi:hypothetical protein
MNVFKCPKCGKTTSSREKFCIDCGEPLDIHCPECGDKWRFMFENKFCPSCGHKMKAAAEPPAPEVPPIRKPVKK